ncbi:MAG: 16S rRNA (adenine(1518)-N(6)/adenine(1519)-N(6))-dimethyltransferase RsmA [Saprospiraceae bacterium]|nr:16S rRNA (adenine(1518)-N(6)/adenine(1519)-N(6))-dimethyltransferase RsmA [Saprospiraceae bacterium]HMW37971.1 16S rRNA (adenine(1518)-N(6)/adenine(1519)-N(6))-dimethyltransferase RsmA [Saprospiraceae bacterium]HMX87645.1 16S rRNA (adenine(1518)-N(6)/adenine(1519)-N(6))-dimethyltransferase RsmA [Saprospiraceae bacterium]HMZ39460.1 16S rRNA (adenine(1518)-N(6)/adenine(1519)-N(6))-dimethyltransferase RsmA [Saprospiraceae bacterium]HNA63246.1 16S rRNA (adenine(1518)-N(6)/adenine(1519)-N(6))-dim
MHKAKKSYGQHFLIQQRTIERIIALIKSFNQDYLLEIGPGRAALTSHLLASYSNFQAIDADIEMIEYLYGRFPNNKDQFIHGDILKTNFTHLFGGRQFLLCGNFPYNISSQIVFKMLENRDQIPVMVGMFQKEMARRIIASPGNKDYGIISVIASLFYSGKIAFDVGPDNFNPPPKVMSSILVLTRNNYTLDEIEFKKILRLIKTAFQFRRKTLRNNLRTAYPDNPVLNNPFFDRRPEELSPSEFVELISELNTD